jgi:zinc/manganese transport system substrate-binding protein
MGHKAVRGTLVLLGVVLAAVTLPVRDSHAESRIRVATTLPTFAALVREVGGERVEVSSVASPRFNPHFIEPRPSDVLRLKRADLFVHGGLDLEAWRDPLLDAVARAEFRAGGDRQLDLSVGVPLLNIPTTQLSRSHGDIHLHGNPHFWTDPEIGLILVKVIAAKLAEVAPQYAEEFSARAASFIARLSGENARWREATRRFSGQKLVAYHDEWSYLMRFLGLKIERFVEPKPGIPPTPQSLEALKDYIRSEKVRVIVQSSYFPTDAAKAVASTNGAKVLVLCQSVGELPGCDDYLSMTRNNIEAILGALEG